MLKFEILTIFPELFSSFQEVGLVGRAISEGRIGFETQHLRDHAINTHGQIDDTPYGGGSGMLLRPEPAKAAIESAKKRLPNAKVVLFSPRGQVFDQKKARELGNENAEYILLCTRYEGVDQRVVDEYIDIELNMGDYVMMGGEVPAMAFIESVSRLVPGVLGNPESTESESFESGLLEYPQYTKPAEYEGMQVPEILLSGNHAKIDAWRKEQAIKDTAQRRPDLAVAELKPSCDLSVALIHYPVMNKEGKVITSSITNLDIHDIARSCCTYGVKHYYIVHPVKVLRRLAGKILEHWDVGYGAGYNPNRKEALGASRVVTDFDEVLIDIEERTGKLPKVVTTSAQPSSDLISFTNLSAKLRASSDPHLIIFGTGWGLAQEFLDRADYRLEPIYGPGEYNHLSVRAAAAIILDRLLAP
jgi:tRNA (guanine37-N1)-methyltransferase